MAEKTTPSTSTTSTSSTDGTSTRRPRRRGLIWAIAGGALVVVVLGAGAGWFLGRDAPDAVDIDTAASGVTSTTVDGAAGSGSSTAGSGSSTDGTTTDGLDGTWTVDTSTGEFDFDSATGTFAGFRIAEELAGIGSTEAVGRTGDVSGSFTISGTTVTDAEFTVDLTTITTNDSMRDRRVQDALETGEFPDATFRLAEPIELGADAANGQTVEVTAEGELTIHGVTKDVSVPLQARLVDGTVVVVGSVDVTFSDYDVEVPSSMKVLSVDDHGTVELQLLLKR